MSSDTNLTVPSPLHHRCFWWPVL